MTNNMNKKLHYVQSEHNPQAMKELNQSKDWKPVNPCTSCKRDDCDDCVDGTKYFAEADAQRKLLEYLIATASGGGTCRERWMGLP